MRGRFITFEGGEGGGKSTHVRLLANFLRSLGLDVLCTREPGGAPAAEVIRHILIEGATEQFHAKTEVLLHYAARHEHLVKTIQPALREGTWVISDRFADSTMAYQGFGFGVDTTWISGVDQLVRGDLSPDLTIILDISVGDGRSRVLSRARSMDRYDEMELSFHSRVRAGFMTIAQSNPGRCRVIDASASIEDVATAIRQEVSDAFDLELSGNSR